MKISTNINRQRRRCRPTAFLVAYDSMTTLYRISCDINCDERNVVIVVAKTRSFLRHPPLRLLPHQQRTMLPSCILLVTSASRIFSRRADLLCCRCAVVCRRIFAVCGESNHSSDKRRKNSVITAWRQQQRSTYKRSGESARNSA